MGEVCQSRGSLPKTGKVDFPIMRKLMETIQQKVKMIVHVINIKSNCCSIFLNLDETNYHSCVECFVPMKKILE